MKLLKTISLLVLTTIVVLSCKKDATKNREQELRGTLWSGEFLYTYDFPKVTTTQPFSLLLNADQTITWFDISGEHPGVWSILDNKITITFFDG